MYIQLVKYKQVDVQRSPNLRIYGLFLPYPEPTSPDSRKITYAHVKVGDNSFLVYQRPIIPRERASRSFASCCLLGQGGEIPE